MATIAVSQPAATSAASIYWMQTYGLRKINYIDVNVCIYVGDCLVHANDNVVMSNQYVNYKCDTFSFVYVFPSIDLLSLSGYLMHNFCLGLTGLGTRVNCNLCRGHSTPIPTISALENLQLKRFRCHSLYYILHFVVLLLAHLLAYLNGLADVCSNCRVFGFYIARHTLTSRYLFID